MTTETVLAEIEHERDRQDVVWGEQNHPNGTGMSPFDAPWAKAAKAICQAAASAGKVTWRDILNEEVRESFAESDPVKLRAELVQVAAVCVAWIESIDRAAIE